MEFCATVKFPTIGVSLKKKGETPRSRKRNYVAGTQHTEACFGKLVHTVTTPAVSRIT